MNLLRRRLLRDGLALLGAARLPIAFAAAPTPAHSLDAARLPAFVDALTLPPCPTPGSAVDPQNPGRHLPLHALPQRAVEQYVHRDLPRVPMWTYGGSFPGPTLRARRDQPLLVDWINALPDRHFLPIDHHLAGCGPGVPEVRTVAHLHGGRTPARYDGDPMHWILPGQRSRFRYPNGQDAATLWYHDHAMGIDRLNIYAGLAGFYLLGDAIEDALDLPSGEFELPLHLCDRLFTPGGALHYPTSGIPGRPWVPEVFGDAVLVNGRLWPYHSVRPRAYRLRLLNGANARFFNLDFDGLPVWQIGSDQGLLGAPVPLRRLLLAPAERADLVIDFGAAGGRDITLRSGALPVLQFRVARGGGPAWTPPTRLAPFRRLAAGQARRHRPLTLDEYEHRDGEPMEMLLNATPWSAPVTETPRLHDVEIWDLINLTADTHPIHLHLVRFQILERQSFDTFAYKRGQGLRHTAPPRLPGADEAGWKDVTRAYPGMVTRIIVPFDGYTGRYMWHCHLLEHQDNTMMRPYEVRPARL
jgi:Putative multicopper oxidases